MSVSIPTSPWTSGCSCSAGRPPSMPPVRTKLAACLELAGQDADARVVRHASIRRSYQTKNPVVRLWGNVQDIVVGYGYAPGRAMAIFVLLLLGAGLWFAFGVSGCSGAGFRAVPGQGR